jgi:predicted DNA-binding protein
MTKIRVKYGKHDGEVVTVSYSVSKNVAERIAKLATAKNISKSKMIQEIIEKELQCQE